MITDFLRGAVYVSAGCRDFYRDVRAWKYVIVPWLALTGVYVLAFCGIFALFRWVERYLEELVAELPGWLSWLGWIGSCLTGFIGIVLAILLLSVTISTLYEMFGGLFFDGLISYHEQKKYGYPPRKMSWKENAGYLLDACCFGLESAAVFLGLLIVSLFLPFFGKIILAVVMGYYYGISYIVTPANMHGVTLDTLRKRAEKKRMVVLGFGITAYLLFLFPLITLFLLPGVVLGGTQLFNNELMETENGSRN